MLQRSMNSLLLLLLLLLLVAGTAAAFFPRIVPNQWCLLHVAHNNGFEMATFATTNSTNNMPLSFDPDLFDVFEGNWSTSFNNPYVMAAYGRYLETGEMDLNLKQAFVAQRQRLEQRMDHLNGLSSETKRNNHDLDGHSSSQDQEEEHWQQLRMEGERCPQRDLEATMKGLTTFYKKKRPTSESVGSSYSRWVQVPKRPEPSMSNPWNTIQQTPQVPPVTPPTRTY